MLNRSRRSTQWVLVTTLFLLAAGWAGGAQATLIDFESVAHGEIVNTQIPGITIVADNPNRSFSYAVGFDSSLPGSSDPDLESASGPGSTLWSGGNLQGIDLGMLLILQENDSGCSDGVSLCLDPDDEGSRPEAGTLSIIFDTPVLSFGFDLVDLESTSEENGWITFSGDGGSETLSFMDFLGGLELGDNTANRISPFLAAELNLGSISQVDITLGGSAGIDNLNFQTVPEPGTLALLTVGFVAMGLRRQR